MTYKFVTREDIQRLSDEGYVPDMKGEGQCSQCGINWKTLLAEREAYREVAILHCAKQLTVKKEGGTREGDFVDAEAAALLSGPNIEAVR